MAAVAVLLLALALLASAADAGTVRMKRGTCDNSIDEMNRLACNAYCVAQLNGYSGGKCLLGTCVCYK
uniref:Defensin 5 n=1 Tax=Locusta migratoria TaxID=7004 RepID=A0A140IM59_LOCMI|nr:defensin 5 [Locusta migratoria]